MSIKVAVVVFEDARDNIEKDRKVRESEGVPDFKDYTSDKDFGGNVAYDISRMIAEHLEYSGSFKEVTFVDRSSNEITPDLLDSFSNNAYDAVLAGKIKNFFGYYDQRPSSSALAQFGMGLAFGIPVAILTTRVETSEISGPFGTVGEMKEIKINPIAIGLATSAGMMLGSYMESKSERKIERRTQLELRLIDTEAGNIIWRDKVDVDIDEESSYPGINTSKRKQQVAVESLKSAVNEIVRSISNAGL
jgi:hypothetical protein